MKLRIPLYFTCACMISLFSNTLIEKWVPDLKPLIFGILLGLSFFVVEKSGKSNKQVSKPLSILIIGLVFVVGTSLNYFYYA
ncbi:hypothetical protein SAMN05216378_3783 [Paenibacillus catalpae]|uniref:Uncharacterized protein n=1 Tax=Paenibacillus catalpae TaxID=1045775 RepID=A0A1I2C5G8_9BACL|nr:hypothetical protein SAMN05216378_3783 [Paenibacillus catalpae]